MQNQPNANDVKKAMELASTQEGKQLMELLKQQDNGQIRQALALSSAGDYEAAAGKVSQLLNTPEIRRLLQNLGR